MISDESVYAVESMDGLLKRCSRAGRFKNDVFYRGQGRDYPLIPSLCRVDPRYVEASWAQLEDDLIIEFKKEAFPYITKVPVNKMEWLVLAQHHGLPTRLLDWTTSLSVALYFAVEDLDENADGYIYCYQSSTYYYDPVEVDDADDCSIIGPHRKFSRIAEQGSCLSIHKLPKSRERFIPLDEKLVNSKLSSLVKVRIPGELKFKFLCELDDLGVTRQSIYPGLEGIAETVKWRIRRIKDKIPYDFKLKRKDALKA